MEFRKIFLGERPALFKSGQWHFHQDNAPVYNSILVTDYLTKMGIKTVPQPPYSPDLATRDFWLFRKLRGCRYETIKEIKEVVTKVTDTLTRSLPEVVGKVQQVHCSGRRGLEFYVCTINKSAHAKKAWKLIVCTSYVYIYIYCHPQIDCFVVWQLFSVARNTRCLKLASELGSLNASRISYRRSIFIHSVNKGIFS